MTVADKINDWLFKRGPDIYEVDNDVLRRRFASAMRYSMAKTGSSYAAYSAICFYINGTPRSEFICEEEEFSINNESAAGEVIEALIAAGDYPQPGEI